MLRGLKVGEIAGGLLCRIRLERREGDPLCCRLKSGSMASKTWAGVNASSVAVLTGEISKLSSTKAQCRLSSPSLHSSPISFSLQSSNVSFSLRSLRRRTCGAVAAEMAATKAPLKLEKVKLTKQQIEKVSS